MDPDIEYYEVYKDYKPVDFQGPLLTKEQHKKIEKVMNIKQG